MLISLTFYEQFFQLKYSLKLLQFVFFSQKKASLKMLVKLSAAIIGFDETYVAITWLNWNILHVHHWSDGQLKMTFQWGKKFDWVSIL